MIYEHHEDLAKLAEAKLITIRKHPTLPLWIHNYTAGAQSLSIKEWSPALCDCRGLILDDDGEVIGRPFSKFWNYEQVLDQIPAGEPFTVWEKLDGSLGIVCNWRGNLVVATRGSFESEQAIWAHNRLGVLWPEDADGDWVPAEGLTYLFEIIYPENRIVVDYGDTSELRLLAVMEADGRENLKAFEGEHGFPKARQFSPGMVFNADGTLDPYQTPGEEGYVVRWANGFRAKVKFDEYKRLHRLITQVSTRTIWELLRAGKPLDELVERVPDGFRDWVNTTIKELCENWGAIRHRAHVDFQERPFVASRKEEAEYIRTRLYPQVLFALLDGKPTDDMIWKMIEPKWATPFRQGVEG